MTNHFSQITILSFVFTPTYLLCNIRRLALEPG